MLTSIASTPRSRRTAITMTGKAAALGAAAFSLAACTDDGKAKSAAAVDQLITQADRARSDAAAAAAAIALAPDKAASLTTISAERTAHATLLDAEIARAAGNAGATTTSAPSSSVAAAPAGVDTLVTALSGSARSAADLARTLSGYRAGLLGSISASCSTQVAVLLP